MIGLDELLMNEISAMSGSFGMPVYKGGTLLDYVNHIHSLGPRSRLSVGDVNMAVHFTQGVEGR